MNHWAYDSTRFDSLLQESETKVEWDTDQHGEDTKVMRKSDGRIGVSITPQSGVEALGELKIRFDDDYSESNYTPYGDVWVLSTAPSKPADGADWDPSKHGKGTKVMRKSDGRRGVSTMDCDSDGEIKIKFDDDGSLSHYVKTGGVWVLVNATLADLIAPLPRCSAPL
eukprot:COSAG04_NODE_11738_length_691_cov_2.081081_1_plen_167_part_10